MTNLPGWLEVLLWVMSSILTVSGIITLCVKIVQSNSIRDFFVSFFQAKAKITYKYYTINSKIVRKFFMIS